MIKRTFLFLIILFLSACSSTTIIYSEPPGAEVFIDDSKVGYTPYKYTDLKFAGETTHIRLEKEGYETYYTLLTRDEQLNIEAIFPGGLALFPLMWYQEYYPTHTYKLELEKSEVLPDNTTPQVQTKAERLRDLKALLDEGILTQEEYIQEKKKVLEEK